MREMRLGKAGVLAAVLLAGAAPRAAHGASLPWKHIGGSAHPMAAGGSHEAKAEPRPGYLGVVLKEADANELASLHRKGNHGVVVWSVDRDAPAAAAGLRPGDVLLAVNGKKIEGIEGAHHALKNLSCGTVLSLRVGRDTGEQTVVVQLGDEEQIAREAEQRIGAEHFGGDPPDLSDAPPAAAAPMPGGVPVSTGGAALPAHGMSFLGAFSINALYTGLDIEALSTQLADFFGVRDGAGLLVRTVNGNSPGAAAGLKAGDVILRVNGEPVVSRMDWIKQLHANRGRSVQLSVVRKGKEQGLTLTPGLGR